MHSERGEPAEDEGSEHLDAAHRPQPRRLPPRDPPHQEQKQPEGRMFFFYLDREGLL